MPAPELGVQLEDVEMGEHVCARVCVRARARSGPLSSCKHMRCHGDPCGGGVSKLGTEAGRGTEVEGAPQRSSGGTGEPGPVSVHPVLGIRKCGQNYSPQTGPCQLKRTCFKNECISGHLGSADFFSSNLTASFTFLLAIIS